MTKRTAIYERSPESHWHWSWLFTCRKQTHFIIHKFNFFLPLLKHIWQSLWQYFRKQPVCHTWLYLTVPIFQKLLQTLQSVSLWQVAAAAGASRLIWDTASTEHLSACSLWLLLSAPFHSRIASLPFLSMSAASSWNKQHVQLSNLCTYLLL